MRVEAVPVIAVLDKLQGPENPLSIRVVQRKKETAQTKCVQYEIHAMVVGAYARPLRGGGRVRVEAVEVSGSTWRVFGVNLEGFQGQPDLL